MVLASRNDESKEEKPVKRALVVLLGLIVIVLFAWMVARNRDASADGPALDEAKRAGRDADSFPRCAPAPPRASVRRLRP